MFPELPGTGAKGSGPRSPQVLFLTGSPRPAPPGASPPLGLSPWDSAQPLSCVSGAQETASRGGGEVPSCAEFSSPGLRSPPVGSQQLSQLFVDSASDPIRLLFQAVPGRGNRPPCCHCQGLASGFCVTLCHPWTAARGGAGWGRGAARARIHSLRGTEHLLLYGHR